MAGSEEEDLTEEQMNNRLAWQIYEEAPMRLGCLAFIIPLTIAFLTGYASDGEIPTWLIFAAVFVGLMVLGQVQQLAWAWWWRNRRDR